MANITSEFEIPSWAGKPPVGLHLDVVKETKMIQKLMIDEKKCYLFGRNKLACDFSIDHGSCSRVHAALVWHKHLNRPFLIDLASVHGTYIGSIQLEGKKPQAVPLDSEIHFGASSRRYIIRERPQTLVPALNSDDKTGEELEGGLMGLPETESELDNLTEFNTAHNRRVTAIPDIADAQPNPLKRKRKSFHVQFNDVEDVINPEDIDPSIGRFRNMVSTVVIPAKKPRTDDGGQHVGDSLSHRLKHLPYQTSLYSDMEVTSGGATSVTGSFGSFSIASKLGLKIPNLAPDVDAAPRVMPPIAPVPAAPPIFHQEADVDPLEPKKKKYAKEAWPGKKPTASLLV